MATNVLDQTYTWFLESSSIKSVYVCVCVFPPLITIHMPIVKVMADTASPLSRLEGIQNMLCY